jgi:hypothetical protein
MGGSRSRSRPLRAAAKDDGTQIQRVRRLCLTIPETIEKLSHGEPTFFTPKRVFAMFANNHHNDAHVAVWLPAAPGVQDALVEEDPQIFFRPPYVGPSGWIGVELSEIDDGRLGALIREAYHLIVARDRRAATGPSRRRGSQKRR